MLRWKEMLIYSNAPVILTGIGISANDNQKYFYCNEKYKIKRKSIF